MTSTKQVTLNLLFLTNDVRFTRCLFPPSVSIPCLEQMFQFSLPFHLIAIFCVLVTHLIHSIIRLHDFNLNWGNAPYALLTETTTSASPPTGTTDSLPVENRQTNIWTDVFTNKQTHFVIITNLNTNMKRISNPIAIRSASKMRRAPTPVLRWCFRNQIKYFSQRHPRPHSECINGSFLQPLYVL